MTLTRAGIERLREELWHGPSNGNMLDLLNRLDALEKVRDLSAAVCDCLDKNQWANVEPLEQALAVCPPMGDK